MVSPLYKERVYVDSSALIYAIETPQSYPGLQTKFLDLFVRGELTMVTSWITFAEVLVRPIQQGDTLIESGYRGLFVPSAQFEILPIDQHISEQAASLRATHGFKLPDAIHIASGLAAGCTHFLTGDAKWARAGLEVVTAASL